MKRITIKELFASPEAHTGHEITVCGWCRSIRANNNFGFIDLNDGSTLPCLQVVFDAEKLANYKEVAKQNVGASFAIKGQLLLTPEAKQPFELSATDIEITGTSTPDYPLQKKRHSDEFLRTIAHLRARTNKFEAVFRVRSVAAYAIHKFFQERNFVYVHTPIITGSDCEGAGEMFRVTTLDLENLPKTEDGKVDFSQDFFGKSTNLTVSGQLNVETYAMAFANVYTFGPTFRAEKSNTPRHAAEFWMMEPEMAFADLNDDMEVIEAMLKYVVSYIMKECPRELELFNKFIDTTLLERLNNIVNSDFVRLPYTEAVTLLKESGVKFDYPVEWGMDLQTEHERYLTEQVYGKPVFVTDWPRDIKAFYMRVNDDGKTVAAVDLLVPGVGELVGGSQREERLDVLLESIEKFDLKAEDYHWYVDLRRYGGTKHAGFGLGFERLIMYVTGISNIRDVESFPRTTGSAEF
ncbi:MAG: asparagine--tRNA ligase [Ruminococcaceae bacterium]|nr:asparagine--tRNA ligase [Oscillospiraceae bacterium]